MQFFIKKILKFTIINPLERIKKFILKKCSKFMKVFVCRVVSQRLNKYLILSVIFQQPKEKRYKRILVEIYIC